MEVKVSVDGVPRVVCGVTEETTCQEVVVALAQALGQPGRYMLREKFKEFERCMTPSERLLETLEKYGEQAREVQLTLLLSGPPVLDEMSRTNVGRYQPCPPLRRKDAGARMRRGSGSLSVHRQSLPLLPCSRHEAEQPREDIKRPKRKSLTLMEEAWEWLESLGKGRVYSTACDTESSKKSDKKKRTSLNVLLTPDREGVSRSKVRGQKGLMSDLDHQTSCCMGSQTKGKASKHCKKRHEAKSDDPNSLSFAIIEDERNRVKERVISQLGSLQDLEAHIARVDKHIVELEEKQRTRRAEEEAQQRMAQQEMEQIMYWENELKAEERHEKHLQSQFLQIKAKTIECKAKLQEYKDKINGLHFFSPQNVGAKREDLEKVGTNATTEVSAKDANQQPSDPDRGVNVDRKFPHRDVSNSPHALVSPSHIKERRPTGPTELREWWKRWSEARNTHSQAKQLIHRSELTIYLGSTKDENKGMRTKENSEL